MVRLAVVIEDEPRIAELVQLLLDRAGFTVRIATDGKKGLDAIRKHKPDLVITDAATPGPSGMEVCRWIRSHALLADTRIIAMTNAGTEPRHNPNAKDVHVDAYLEKPFDINDLLTRIYTLFPEDPGTDPDHESSLSGSDDLVRARSAFRKQVPGLIGTIETLWARYRDGHQDAGLLHQLHQAVRGMTGAASLNGFAELSRYSMRLENLIGAIRENKGAIIQTQGQEIEDLFENLWSDREVGVHRPVKVAETGTQADRSPLKHDHTPGVVCLFSDNADTARRLATGLAAFDYRLKTFSHASDEAALVGARAVLVDLSQMDSEGVLLHCVEQCRMQTDLRARILGFGYDEALNDRVVGELIRHGCWQVLDGPVDGFRIAELLERERMGEEHPFRVLILDDQSMGEHFQIMLKSMGILTDVLDDHERLQLHMREFKPDLVLIGEGMGDLTSISLIRLVRNLAPDVPIVVATDSADDQLVYQVRSGGGTDVLPVGISPERLSLSLTTRMICCRTNRNLLRRDSTSGALRFPLFLERLGEELKWANRAERPLSVAIAGLDAIEDLNNHYGVNLVDRLLRALVSLFRHMGGNDVLVGRVGGNRLGICFPKNRERETRQLLNDVRKRFSNIRFQDDTGTVSVSFSVGMITTGSDHDPMVLCQAGEGPLLQGQKNGWKSHIDR